MQKLSIQQKALPHSSRTRCHLRALWRGYGAESTREISILIHVHPWPMNLTRIDRSAVDDAFDSDE